MLKAFGCSGTLRWLNVLSQMEKPRAEANPNTSITQFLGKLRLGEFLEVMDTPSCSSSHQTLVLLILHPPPAMVWCTMGHSLSERPQSALFICSKRIII